MQGVTDLNTDGLSNPFYLGPVIHPEIFAGRREHLRSMEALMRDAQRGIFRHAAIIGKPGMGKTSLLNAFESRAEQHSALVVRVDLDKTLTPGSDPLDFFRGLEIAVLRALRRKDPDLASYVVDVMRRFWGVETEALAAKSKVKLNLELPKIGGISWERAIAQGRYAPLSLMLKSDFAQLGERAQEREVQGVVLVIDEGHIVVELPQATTILQVLKNTFQSQDAYSMVVCGDAQMLENISALHEGFGSLFEPLILSELSDADASALINLRLDLAAEKGGCMPFQEGAIGMILEDAKGSPRRIVRYCCLAVEEARRRSTAITPSLIESLKDKLPRTA